MVVIKMPSASRFLTTQPMKSIKLFMESIIAWANSRIVSTPSGDANHFVKSRTAGKTSSLNTCPISAAAGANACSNVGVILTISSANSRNVGNKANPMASDTFVKAMSIMSLALAVAWAVPPTCVSIADRITFWASKI